MPDCIFCRIVKGEIPCAKIYEDERVLSFLDIGPISPGHALVLPRAHYTTIFEISEEDLKACAAAAQKVGRAVFEAVGAQGLNLLQNNFRAAGQLVDHIHFHLIPRHSGDGFMTSWPAKSYPQGGLEEMLEKVKAAMRG